MGNLPYNISTPLLFHLGQFADAIRHEPNDAAYHYNLGLALGHLGQHDAAEAALREALRLRPTFGAATEALEVVKEQKAKARK